jgi:hypothetical protein
VHVQGRHLAALEFIVDEQVRVTGVLGLCEPGVDAAAEEPALFGLCGCADQCHL